MAPNMDMFSTESVSTVQPMTIHFRTPTGVPFLGANRRGRVSCTLQLIQSPSDIVQIFLDSVAIKDLAKFLRKMAPTLFM